MNRVLHPGPWKLNGSALTPQFCTGHGQPGGPPIGAPKLLMMDKKGSPNFAPGGPDTPSPLAGSAQRQVARNPAGTSKPIGSAYCAVKNNSPRPTSSMMAIVLLRPSVMSLTRVPPVISALGAKSDPPGRL